METHRIQIVENRISHLVKSEKISLDTNTQSNINKTQLTGFNGLTVHDDRPIFQHYGFTSAPLAGAHAISLSGYGVCDNKLVIGTHDTRHHPTGLTAGECQIYDNNAQKVYLSVNGVVISAKDKFDIQVNGKSIITGDANGINITGDLTVSGKITASGDVVGSNISLSEHTHSVPKAPGTSGPPLNN